MHSKQNNFFSSLLNYSVHVKVLMTISEVLILLLVIYCNLITCEKKKKKSFWFTSLHVEGNQTHTLAWTCLVYIKIVVSWITGFLENTGSQHKWCYCICRSANLRENGDTSSTINQCWFEPVTIHIQNTFLHVIRCVGW